MTERARALILEHLDWTKRTALFTIRRHRLLMDPDEAVAAANLALVRLALRYRKSMGRFRTYARHRICGAVLDRAHADSIDVGRTGSRRRFRLPELDLADVAWSLPDPRPGPVEQFLALERARQLVALFRFARAREREVLWYQYVDGLTMAEIAPLMRVTESRVCQLAQEGIRRVRAGLGLPPT